ncbi:hypothetical protein SASPL_140619 [Salvia splendens]|uniref:Uncharacterized protein n=1 Tax=Salvia splendens TaxID=180675 RepID=A0A8X8WS84_SALSN|nr:hypothetical protein SASPL_140619 [Salvia splendens]
MTVSGHLAPIPEPHVGGGGRGVLACRSSSQCGLPSATSQQQCWLTRGSSCQDETETRLSCVAATLMPGCTLGLAITTSSRGTLVSLCLFDHQSSYARRERRPRDRDQQSSGMYPGYNYFERGNIDIFSGPVCKMNLTSDGSGSTSRSAPPEPTYPARNRLSPSSSGSPPYELTATRNYCPSSYGKRRFEACHLRVSSGRVSGHVVLRVFKIGLHSNCECGGFYLLL